MNTDSFEDFLNEATTMTPQERIANLNNRIATRQKRIPDLQAKADRAKKAGRNLSAQIHALSVEILQKAIKNDQRMIKQNQLRIRRQN